MVPRGRATSGGCRETAIATGVGRGMVIDWPPAKDVPSYLVIGESGEKKP